LREKGRGFEGRCSFFGKSELEDGTSQKNLAIAEELGGRSKLALS